MANYVSSAVDPHELSEEQQWADILESGEPRRGMLLVFVQKLCTALHEYGPSHAAGIIDDAAWPFIRRRLSSRIRKVLDVARDNNLYGLAGIDELARLAEEIDKTARMPSLSSLADRIHAINHSICDNLAACRSDVRS